MVKINNINISGPINIVRVEGSIDGNNKVLYLLFDYHTKETKCSDYNSIDVVQLFDKFTNEAVSLNNEWDLFIEDDLNYISNKDIINKSNYSDIYLVELRNFFNNKYSETVNNLVKRKDNIRYHYFDIRWKLNFSYVFSSLEKLIANNYKKEIFYDKAENIYKLLLIDYDNLFKKENKINKKYNNMKVKEIVFNILSVCEEKFKILLKDFKDIIEDLEKSNDIFLKRLNEYGDYEEYNYEIKQKIIKFSYDYKLMSVRITDLYFLRRFLDKKYIKNGVIYSGGWHCLNIIRILVKLLNFKITNLSYSNINLENLNKFVKNSKDFFELRSVLFPEYFIQCSSMEGFPDMFL